MSSEKVTGWICGPRLYEYKGWFFEVSAGCGPWPLCKDGEPRKRAGDAFWKTFDEFMKEKDISKFRVGGGCVPI